MARQIIDIGIQGNDGTGDSIRESFRKVNDNFSQLFSIFGQGDKISFTDLDDAPSSYLPNQVFVASEDGTSILAKDIVGGSGIIVNNSDPFQLEIINSGGSLQSDEKPVLGAHLNANGKAIANIATPDDFNIALYNNLHDGPDITLDDLVINKRYADTRYLQAAGTTGTAGQIRIREEPVSYAGYEFVIDDWVGGFGLIPNNDFNSGINGSKFVYENDGDDPASGLISGNVYYIRYVDSNRIALYSDEELAKTDFGTLEQRILVNISPEIPIEDRGIEKIIDGYVDKTLPGFWLRNEALPRESIVRRQGDTMTGPLLLSDHPAPFAGVGTPNGADDLQAATKYYVDSSSFASKTNLYVATSGTDNQSNLPLDRQGRGLSYAYASVGAACKRAEEIIEESLKEPGPYRQPLTYGDNIYNANLVEVDVLGSVEQSSRILKIFTNGQGVDQSVTITNRDLREGSIIKGLKSGATARVITYDGVIGDNDEYTIELLHKITDLTQFEANYFNAGERLVTNKTFIAEQTVAFIDSKYLSVEYDRSKCLRDSKLIVQAIADDIKFGGNRNSLEAGRSYWGNVVSVLPEDQRQSLATIDASIDGDQLTVDSFVDGFVYLGMEISGPGVAPGTKLVSQSAANVYTVNIVQTVSLTTMSLVGVGPTVDAINYIFKLAENVINNNPGDPIPPFDSLTMGVDNVAVRFLQPIIENVNGVPTNISTNTIQDFSGTAGLQDAINLVEQLINTITYIVQNEPQLDPLLNTDPYLEFLIGEELEYGQPVPEQQITIMVESGIYYEQMPIRIPPNVSINGDELRRVIIRPAPGESQSQWVRTYFYRDEMFDGMTRSYYSELAAASTEELNVSGITPNGSELTINFATQLDFPFPENGIIELRNVTPASFNGFYIVKNSGLSSIIVDSENTDTYVSGGIIVGSKVKLSSGNTDNLKVGMYLKIIDGDGSIAETIQVKELLPGGTEFLLSTTPTVKLDSATLRGLDLTNLSREPNPYDPSDIFYNFGYHYLINPDDPNSLPKENKDMDVFLLNDATIIRNLTCQGHGGFMCVLDPSGQIQTKSPYFQTNTTLSGSINKQRFAGGMYIDGFAGNLPAVVDSKNSNTELVVSGLTVRSPLVPTAFYVNGERYQVNVVRNWDGNNAIVKLDESTPYSSSIPPGGLDIIFETPGNRSMLANDFTQVNDLSYGVVATNNGITELVSVFSYYNWTSYFANTGGQIRSVAGNSSYGQYGLRAEGRDPREVPDIVYLSEDTVQLAKIYKRGIFSTESIAGEQTLYIDNYQYIPFNISEIEIDHSGTRSKLVNNSASSPNNIFIENGGSGYVVGEILTVVGGTEINGNVAKLRVLEIDEGSVGGPGVITKVQADALGSYSVNPLGGTDQGQLTFTTSGVGVGAIILATFRGDTVRYELGNVTVEDVISDSDGKNVLKINLNIDVGVSGLLTDLVDGQDITIRCLENLKFNDVQNVVPARANSAIKFVDPTEQGTAYKSLSYNLTNPDGSQLPDNEAIISFDDSYGYAFIQVNSSFINDPDYTSATVATVQTSSWDSVSRTITFTSSADHGFTAGDQVKIIGASPATYNGTYVIKTTPALNTFTVAKNLDPGTYVSGGTAYSNSITLGYNIGDTKIAIIENDANVIARINNGKLYFGWKGSKYRILSFTDANPSLGFSGYITIDAPLTERIPNTETITLRSGINGGEEAELTLNISTCRASSHDMLDVGTGGFNDTNYPNNLLGAPANPPNDANEVIQDSEGRVFYVTTDQKGFFKVGKFFSVDQGTGTVKFSASIALSRLDGLGFKKGIEINEFTQDTEFDAATNKQVPTARAIREYIDRRLGITHQGAIVDASERKPTSPNEFFPEEGGGFVALSGRLAMYGDLDMGGSINGGSGTAHRIINLAPPSSNSDAVNLGTLVSRLEQQDELTELNDVSILNSAVNDIPVFIDNGILTNAQTVGDIEITHSYITSTTTSLIGGITSGSTIDVGILGTGQASVSGGVVVASVAGFDLAGGYFRIGSEIFSYDSITIVDNRFDGVERAKLGTISSIHSSGTTVTKLDGSQVDLQIVPDSIVNADVNSAAAIDQSKLNLNSATTRANATGIAQADLGVASFDSGTFNSTNGWVSVSTGGISLSNIQTISDNTVLGNLTGATAHPEEISLTNLISGGIENTFTTIDNGANVLTIRKNSLLLTATFSGLSGSTSLVGSGTISNVPVVTIDGIGTGAIVNVSYNSANPIGSQYTSITVVYGGNNYQVGENLRVRGEDLLGENTTNDLTFTIASGIDPVTKFGIHNVSIAAEANSIVKTNNIKDLGTPGNRFNNVYATSFIGTVDGANISGDINAVNVTANTITSNLMFVFGVEDNITASGVGGTPTAQSSAYGLTRNINNVTATTGGTGTAAAGVRLPSAVPGMRVIVRNGTGTDLNVYPSLGDEIVDSGINVPYFFDGILGSPALEFLAFTDTKWYLLNAVFA